MQSFKLNNCLSKSALILCLIILQSFVLNAQIRTRDLSDSIRATKNGVWYNPSFYQFEVQYPKLQVIPPLSMGMDYETLLSYIYLDSLMRSTNRDLLYMNYLDRWMNSGTKNDTIVQAVKYLYKLVDYDPVRFVQYDVNLGKPPYSLNLKSMRGWIGELLSNIVGRFGPNSQALDYLIRADYILKVHINSIDILPQRNYPPNKGLYPEKFTHKVNATVIDTLKGKVFSNCYDEEMMPKQDKIQSISSEICFTYGTGPYENDVNQFKLDPSLKNSSGNLELQPGQDLIVILNHDSYLWDYNYDYFDLSIITAYPIVNGQLKDISHIWSSSSSLNYDDWKTIFLQKKEMLLNGGY
ncbi:MAG: hypothetical protein WC313_10480 [Candidatus Kapaibacterium sp.]